MPFRLLLLPLLSLVACTHGAGKAWSIAAVDTATLTRPAVARPEAHAHNDYEHPRPLLDALDAGFCSVEADVHLDDGELLVAHFSLQTSAERTLRALYLEPLRRRVAANGGRVHPEQPGFTLLVDVKGDAEATYAALREQLADYRAILTHYGPNGVEPGAMTVLLSGNRPRETLAAEAERWVALDGRPPDLDGEAPATLIPLVSSRWGSHFDWNGDGPMPDDERARLRDFATRAHAQGRRLRFWATPEKPAVWAELLDAGVDLIGTDELERLRAFLASR